MDLIVMTSEVEPEKLKVLIDLVGERIITKQQDTWYGKLKDRG